MASRLHLHVDLELASVPIAGSVGSDQHPARPFHGWLELASEVEALRREALTARAPATPDELVPPIEGGWEESIDEGITPQGLGSRRLSKPRSRPGPEGASRGHAASGADG